MKEQLFHWMCLSLKLEFSQEKKKHNINISQLYETAVQEKKHYSTWPKFIRDAFNKSVK